MLFLCQETQNAMDGNAVYRAGSLRVSHGKFPRIAGICAYLSAGILRVSAGSAGYMWGWASST